MTKCSNELRTKAINYKQHLIACNQHLAINCFSRFLNETKMIRVFSRTFAAEFLVCIICAICGKLLLIAGC